MRILVVAAVIALFAVPAHAQGTGGKRHKGSDQQTSEQKKKKASEAEKAYRSAVDKLPDGKYDPWQSIRGSEPLTGQTSGAEPVKGKKKKSN